MPNPCQDGLNAACFAAHPEWARQVFAYRLLHTLFPGAITKRLPPSIAIIASDIPDWWTEGDGLPPPIIQPPEPPPGGEGDVPPGYTDIWGQQPPAGSRTTPGGKIIVETTVISSSSDGTARYFNNTSWDQVHDRVTATEILPDEESVNPGCKTTIVDLYWSIIRAFFYFDLTDLLPGATITDCEFDLWSRSNDDMIASIQEGTQADPMELTDFPSFTGDHFGTTTIVKGTGAPISASTWTFNSAGIAYLNSKLGGVAKICVREYTYDYLDVAPPTPYTDIAAEVFFQERAIEEQRPVLNITYNV